LGYISLNFISAPHWLKIKIGGDDLQIEKVSGFSPTAGLKSGQSDRKRNFEKANIECSAAGGSKECILSILKKD
jgi:hypothetical protein